MFPGDPAGWQMLQSAVLGDIRRALPGNTVVLTGHDWGSIGGLLALTPQDDPNVVYSIHFYDPAELTSLAAYRPGLDRAALSQLPFPATSSEDCDRIALQAADQGTRGLMRFVCAQQWDAARVRAAIGRASAWAERHRVRLLLGEFGVSAQLNEAARLAWLRAVREACEASGIAWALWGYDDVMGFGISRPPPPSPRLDPRMLAALGFGGSG